MIKYAVHASKYSTKRTTFVSEDRIPHMLACSRELLIGTKSIIILYIINEKNVFIENSMLLDTGEIHEGPNVDSY